MTCINSGPSWAVHAVNLILFIAGFLAIYVMQKAEHDQQINRIDARWVRVSRRLCFIAVALFAWGMILTDLSLLAFLMLLISASALLVVDAFALRHRPPWGGQKAFSVAMPVNLPSGRGFRLLISRFRHIPGR